jgi:hypothetical protein
MKASWRSQDTGEKKPYLAGTYVDPKGKGLANKKTAG